jgi:hypothetical protein
LPSGNVWQVSGIRFRHCHHIKRRASVSARRVRFGFLAPMVVIVAFPLAECAQFLGQRTGSNMLQRLFITFSAAIMLCAISAHSRAEDLDFKWLDTLRPQPQTNVLAGSTKAT